MIWENKKNQRLIKAILALDSEAEAMCFLRDLMTNKEIDELSNRFKAAEMLTKKISYIEIEKETGLSSTTIARVSKWLKTSGKGYKNVINKLNEHLT